MKQEEWLIQTGYYRNQDLSSLEVDGDLNIGPVLGDSVLDHHLSIEPWDVHFNFNEIDDSYLEPSSPITHSYEFPAVLESSVQSADSELLEASLPTPSLSSPYTITSCQNTLDGGPQPPTPFISTRCRDSLASLSKACELRQVWFTNVEGLM